MPYFTVFSLKDGQILYPAFGADKENFEASDRGAIECADNTVSAAIQYVDLTVNPPAIRSKQPFPAVANKTEVIADNVDEVIISRVPLGCTCTLDGEPVTVTEELITFTAEHVGTYVFNFSMFPYLDGTITITGKAKDENTGS